MSLSLNSNSQTIYKDTEREAKEGNVNSQYDLAFMYRNGDGFPVNFVKSVYWFKKAAEQDDLEAVFGLTTFFIQAADQVTGKNDAFEVFCKASEITGTKHLVVKRKQLIG